MRLLCFVSHPPSDGEKSPFGLFLPMYGTPSENTRYARGVRVPVRGRSAERTSRRGLFRICHFTGARSASRGCTDPPAGAGGLVHPARILAALVAFASPERGRSAERTSRRGLFRICHFTGARCASRGCTDPPPRVRGGIGTPSENRTRISGSGGRRSIHYPMGADDVCKYTILKSISQV